MEGGRRNYNKWDRRYSHRQHRRLENALLKVLIDDPECYESWLPPVLRRVYKDFWDKLGPAYRFLNSRKNRPWDSAHSLMMRRFDSRTTAGRHILFCHVLRDVSFYFEEHQSWWFRVSKYTVDEHGILKVTRRRRKHRVDGGLFRCCRLGDISCGSRSGSGLDSKSHLARFDSSVACNGLVQKAEAVPCKHAREGALPSESTFLRV